MDICEMCREAIGSPDCRMCSYGNPCLGCADYDEATDVCTSNGGCFVVHPVNQMPPQDLYKETE